jgi:hypothetical protein
MASELRIREPLALAFNGLIFINYFGTGGVMGKRNGNSLDLERLSVDIGHGLGPRSITPVKTELYTKSSSDANAHSWLRGFVKSDGTWVRLFVRPDSRI